MSNSEDLQKVIDFADGKLDPTQEDELFLKLSANDELRQQFKSLMTIKNAIRSGVAGVVVPASSKAAVFSQLGLQIPAGTAAAVSSGSSSGFISFITSRKVVVTAALSLAFTTLMLFMFINNDKDITAAQNDAANAVSTDNSLNITKDIPVISSKETTNSIKSVIAKSELSQDNIAADYRDNEEEQVSSNQNDTMQDDIFIIANSNPAGSRNTSMDRNIRSLQNSSLNMPEYQSLNMDLDLSGGNNITLEFRSSNYFNSQKPTISPKEYSPLNNLALSLLYNANSNLSIGADIRQETFFLRYSGTDNGEDFIYEQQPNFTTFSGIVRYKLDGFNGFKPFAQASAGMNNVGFVGRAMLGVEYAAFSNFSFILGVDFNNLTYTYQNKYFNSSKFGLNYGLTYSF